MKFKIPNFILATPMIIVSFFTIYKFYLYLQPLWREVRKILLRRRKLKIIELRNLIEKNSTVFNLIPYICHLIFFVYVSLTVLHIQVEFPYLEH